MRITGMPVTAPFLCVEGCADLSGAVAVCRHNRDPKLWHQGLAAFSHPKHPLPQRLLHHHAEWSPSGGRDVLFYGCTATKQRFVRRDCFIFHSGIKIGARGERL
jgi:hypothetical protein